MTVTIHNRMYLVPQEWNDLTGEQLIKITKTLLEPSPNPITTVLKLLKVVTGMGWWRFMLCPATDLHENIHLTDFVFTQNTLTKNIFPRVGKLYGPASNFDNLLMDEFAFSEDYFLTFKEDESNVDALNHLVAVLYRPAKRGYNHHLNPDGDARVPFNQYVLDYHIKRTISKWNYCQKLCIAQWYDACRRQLIQNFPTVFSGGSGDPARWGLLSMMRSVAQAGTHGDFERVEKQYVKMIMIELDEMIHEAETLNNSKPSQHG